MQADITAFLTENFCPGTNDPDCLFHINVLYPEMLVIVVDEFIVLGNGQ
jgi:hypothetical protein